MRYLTGVYWSAGSVTEENQDSLLLMQVLTARGRIVMAAVCDGMGGIDKGELASGCVTEQLQRWFYDTLLRAVRKKKRLWVIRRSLDRLVCQIQCCMRRHAGQERISFGTTMSVLVLFERRYLLWHLGDSRIYRLEKKKRVCRMTKDHCAGPNCLTKCVGSFGYFRPDYRMGILQRGEGFLVCSDGFWRNISEAELGDVLNPERIREEWQIEKRLKEIADRDCRRGERDNLSAVYIKAV